MKHRRAARGRGAAEDAEPQKAKQKQASEREVEERIAKAEGLLLRGWTERRVAAEIAHVHSISVRMGWEYVYRVKERWAERVEARKADTRTPEEIDLEHRHRGLMLLDECLKAKELKAAGTVYKLLMELDGRGTSRTVKLDANLKHKFEGSPDIVDAADEVLRKHGYAPITGAAEGASE